MIALNLRSATFVVCQFAGNAEKTGTAYVESRTAEYVELFSVPLADLLLLILLNVTAVENLYAGPIPFASLDMRVFHPGG